ncbi:MAG: HEAT repeat domain-containing protein [Chloroflexi bacterium]|nr:HEAT repeat domain-containing protein [Chloroflexota bacterium]
MVSRRPNIWKLQANKDIDGLIDALTYSDPDIRKRAATALRVLGAAKAVPALRQALTKERHLDVQDHLKAALAHLDESYSSAYAAGRRREELVERLGNPDPKQVMRAAAALGELGDQLATEALVVVFRNPLQRDDVRLAAAEALLKLQSAPAVITLLAGLRKDNWRVRHNAAAVLGQLKTTWATEPLIEALKDPHPNVRLAAAAALNRLQTPRALEALRAYRTKRSGHTQPLSTREVPAKKPQVGEASQVDDTSVRPPSGLRDAIRKLDARPAPPSPSPPPAEPAKTETPPEQKTDQDPNAPPEQSHKPSID